MIDKELQEHLYALENIDADFEAGMAAAKKLSANAKPTWLPELNRLLEGGDGWIREVAAEPIAQLEGISALHKLFRAEIRGREDGDDNDHLAMTICLLLETNQAAAAPILLKRLDSTDATERAQAVWGLGFVANAISADPILTMLDDEDAGVRADAVGALSSFFGDPRTFDRTAAALRDIDMDVRISAITSLAYANDKRAIDLLKPLFDKVTTQELRFVESALNRLGQRPWVEAQKLKRVVNRGLTDV